MKTARIAATLLLVGGLPLLAMAGPAPDMDGDTTPDNIDNCKLVSNPINSGLECDTDSDGYGNMCDCDYDNNQVCNLADFNTFKAGFAQATVPPADPDTDQNCDGVVSLVDFNRFKAGFANTTPGPSGLSCAGLTGCVPLIRQ